MESLVRVWRQGGKYILAFIAIIILIVMVVDFNQRTAEARRLNAERDSVRAEVTKLAATKEYLETRIAYATSDEAVAEWARQQGHMAQPEDRSVVIIPPPNTTPSPTSTPIVTPYAMYNWQVWYTLFFDIPETKK